MIEIDLEAEKKILRQYITKWHEAEVQGDYEACLNFYAEDAIVHPPNRDPVKGKATIREFHKDVLHNVESGIGETTRIEISSSGDLAYDIGLSHMVFKSTEGLVEEVQKYLIVWKKINGEWKCIAISFNSNKPAE